MPSQTVLNPYIDPLIVAAATLATIAAALLALLVTILMVGYVARSMRQALDGFRDLDIPPDSDCVVVVGGHVIERVVVCWRVEGTVSEKYFVERPDGGYGYREREELFVMERGGPGVNGPGVAKREWWG